MAGNTKIEWVRGEDGSEGMSWNALRAVRTVTRDVEDSEIGISRQRVRVSANHCEHVNEACRFCYADRQNARLGGLPFKAGHRKEYTFEVDENKLLEPLRRKKPTRIFVESMSDAFGEWWPDHFIDKLYAVMAATPWHTYINLTKRPERRREYLKAAQGNIWDAWTRLPVRKTNRVTLVNGDPVVKTAPDWPLPNVIEGTSASNQEEADEFGNILFRTLAARRVLSLEPMLGPIKLRDIPIDGVEGAAGNKLFDVLHGIFVGGESGPKARPMHPQWPRELRDECKAAGVAFFFKQWGEWAPTAVVGTGARDAIPSHVFREQGTIKTFGGPIPLGTEMRRVGKKVAGRLLDGVEHNEFPAVMR